MAESMTGALPEPPDGYSDIRWAPSPPARDNLEQTSHLEVSTKRRDRVVDSTRRVGWACSDDTPGGSVSRRPTAPPRLDRAHACWAATRCPTLTSLRSSRRQAAPATNGFKPKRDFGIPRLREWAGANKVAVPARGRIPNSVVEQYRQAGGS